MYVRNLNVNEQESCILTFFTRKHDKKENFYAENTSLDNLFRKTLTVQVVGLPSAAAAPDILVFFLLSKHPGSIYHRTDR